MVVPQISPVTFIRSLTLFLAASWCAVRTRVQCVMELFVFVRMGGKSSDILVKLLSESVVASLAKFDAAKARCFLDKDRQGLLAVIEASFGTCAPFNKIIRALFSQMQLGESPPLQSDLGAETELQA